MARFYGFSHCEIMEMGMDDFNMYLRSIEKIKASEILDGFNVSMFPHIKDNKRTEEVNRLKEKAGPRKRKQVLTMDELANQLKGV